MELSDKLKEYLGMVVEGAEKGAEAYASVSKPVDISSMAGEAVGGKTLEATGSPAAATAADVGTQLVTDPTNLMPQMKMGAGLLGMTKALREAQWFKNLSDAAFAHILADITGKKETVKEFLELGKATKGKVPDDVKERMINEAVRQRGLKDPDWKQQEMEFDKGSALEPNMVVAGSGTYTTPKPEETTPTSGTRG